MGTFLFEDPPLENCSTIKYLYEKRDYSSQKLGLTGIFEVLIVGDKFRQAMVETPHVNQLLAAARSEGHISIRETGVVAVAQGVTSLEELQRVLKK